MWPIVRRCSNLFPECCQNNVKYENVNVSDGKASGVINSLLSDLSAFKLKTCGLGSGSGLSEDQITEAEKGYVTAWHCYRGLGV